MVIIYLMLVQSAAPNLILQQMWPPGQTTSSLSSTLTNNLPSLSIYNLGPLIHDQETLTPGLLCPSHTFSLNSPNPNEDNEDTDDRLDTVEAVSIATSALVGTASSMPDILHTALYSTLEKKSENYP